MNHLKEKVNDFGERYGLSIFGGAFFTMFIVAFASGLGYNAVGFWFLVGTNFLALTMYFIEKRRAERRQQEINRYRKNGIKTKA